MNELYSFLEIISNNSDFKAELSKKGGYVTFSNSGRRGGTKYFQIGLENIIQTLRDILNHLDTFRNLTEYEEKAWRDNGAEYFTDPVANANSTVQTKPLFSTLSKIIIWGNQPLLNNIDPDQVIALDRDYIQTAIDKLDIVSKSFTPQNIIRRELHTDFIQKIYYGCPGSGKSHYVKDITKNVDSNFVFRTTFHPDTDHASFVGCYKPCSNNKSLLNGNNLTEDELLQRFFDSKDEVKYKGDIKARYLYESLINAVDIKNLGENASTIADKLKSKGFDKTAYVTEANCMYKIYNWLKEDGYLIESNITYEFLPQVFTNAYVKAWEDTSKPVYLVIEEINRGNCAQIFGDLFQLLDRDKATGKSEYPIKADKDLGAHIEKVLGASHEGIKNGELCLPPNLIIYATMNTSDQSLFPMDSAFKRRWDWEYVPINYDKNIDSGKFIIKLDDDTKYLWVNFLDKVNKEILDKTASEDKQMGNYFIKGDVNALQFTNKVMFYLWNEVCKEEYGTQRNFFRKGKDVNGNSAKEFSFTDLFKSDNGKNVEQTRIDILKKFMEYLDVIPEPKE